MQLIESNISGDEWVPTFLAVLMNSYKMYILLLKNIIVFESNHCF